MAGLTLEQRKAREKYWLDIISKARVFPQGVQQFCELEGIAKKSYYKWYHKLRQSHPEWEPLTRAGKNFGPRKPRKGIREFWQRKIDQFNGSGLTQAEFCRQEKLGHVSLGNWRRKFEQEANFAADRPADPRPTFVPVKIDAESESTPGEADKVVAELRLAQGRGNLVIYNGASAETIAAIVSVWAKL
jgi:hypothetical protein